MRFTLIVFGVLNLFWLTVHSAAIPTTSLSKRYRNSIAEFLYCADITNNAWACWKARGQEDEAREATAANFPTDMLPGVEGNTRPGSKGDAFRHCYWNARMTIDIGYEKAKAIATKHEQIEFGKSAKEHEMDLKNNDIGRKFGLEIIRAAPNLGKETHYKQVMPRCLEAARTKHLATSN